MKVTFTRKELIQVFGKDTAYQIWSILKDHNPNNALNCIDKILENFGVECLTHYSCYDEYLRYSDIFAMYSNNGDTYAPTILYDYRYGRYLLTSWGDYYESLPRRFQEG